MTDIPENTPETPTLADDIARLTNDLKSLRETTDAMKADDDVDELIAGLSDLIPESVRTGLPTEGSKYKRLFAHVTAALKAAKAPPVPETDTKRPAITPAAEDLSQLPAHARMARGYATA